MPSSDHILLVEDSPDDALATQRAFRRAGLANPMTHCTSGDDGLDYLHHRGDYADADAHPRPGLILLDLNLPGITGHEVLKRIKADAALRSIPVIVLTTSHDERDIEACYQHGANSYIAKPVEFDGLLRAIQSLSDYWFRIVVLPRA